jgi:predicted DNA-binding transcriptional regulator AlpA
MDQGTSAQSNTSVSGGFEDEGFILLTELRPIVPLHPQHIRKLVRRGDFPAPVKIGGRTAFARSAIRLWCRRQTEAQQP